MHKAQLYFQLGSRSCRHFLKHVEQGFSYIEITVCIAILGIVVCFALPSYHHQVIKTNRYDAKHSLQLMAMAQENWRVMHNRYATQSEIEILFGTQSIDGLYTLDIESTTCPHEGDTHCFLLKAQPVAGKPQSDDDACTYFTIDHLGAFGASSEECWL